MRKNLLPFLAGALVLVFVVFLTTGGSPLAEEEVVPKQIIKIGEIEVSAQIADTPEEMTLGLGGRESLPENEGMLFVYGALQPTVYWMKGMRFPLDIIWISEGKVAQISQNVPHEPGVADSDLKRYVPNQAVDAVLEVNAGFAEKNGIKLEDPVVVN